MNTISCDVVLLPNPLLADTAIAASQKLQPFDSFFVLKDGEYFPHASLYMLRLKTKDLPKVAEALSEIARATTPLKLDAYRYYYSRGYIDAEYKKIPELVGLQAAVVQALNPIRDGLLEPMSGVEGLARENLQSYGYKYIGELFRPHITLGRLKHDNPKAMNVLGRLSDLNGSFVQLGLFEMGEHGTCIRQIKTFDFL